ncbi:hypothetical protein N7494_012432 [Penicillium frequentans]|uniref:Uncharacterized protein n=1 Tax=Penicillium frequentans TaxID=3151616 RepID=A0AAD6CPD3_9EURO|nr:hypothetical protein N7494_012432 [Penicillium glabrum]
MCYQSVKEMYNYEPNNRDESMGGKISRPEAPLAATAVFKKPMSGSAWFATSTNEIVNIGR